MKRIRSNAGNRCFICGTLGKKSNYGPLCKEHREEIDLVIRLLNEALRGKPREQNPSAIKHRIQRKS